MSGKVTSAGKEPPLAPDFSMLIRQPIMKNMSLVAPVHAALLVGLLTTDCADKPPVDPITAPTAIISATNKHDWMLSSPLNTAETFPTPRITSFPTLPPVLKPSSLAWASLAALPLAEASLGDSYNWKEHIGGWADPDGNGCDARNDILARDLANIVSTDGCTVESGTLTDPYTGNTIKFVRRPAHLSNIRVDHVVSLDNAWISGADELNHQQRVALANDPLNLLAVAATTNADKSEADASEWLPPNKRFRCQYVATQVAVKTRYDLSVTEFERQAMAEVLTACPGQKLPESELIPQTPITTLDPPLIGNLKSSILGALISFIPGIMASVVAWWVVWRGLSPRLDLSPKITRKMGDSEKQNSHTYRFKVKNVRSKRDALNVSYLAQLRYNNPESVYGNWSSIPIRLALTSRPSITNNAIVPIPMQKVSQKVRSHLRHPIDDELLTVRQLVDYLPNARVYITCTATDSYSGSFRMFTQEYGPYDIMDGLYVPITPFSRWRTWFKVNVRNQVHPEVEVLAEDEMSEPWWRH